MKTGDFFVVAVRKNPAVGDTSRFHLRLNSEGSPKWEFGSADATRMPYLMACAFKQIMIIGDQDGFTGLYWINVVPVDDAG